MILFSRVVLFYRPGLPGRPLCPGHHWGRRAKRRLCWTATRLLFSPIHTPLRWTFTIKKRSHRISVCVQSCFWTNALCHSADLSVNMIFFFHFVHTHTYIQSRQILREWDFSVIVVVSWDFSRLGGAGVHTWGELLKNVWMRGNKITLVIN